MSFGVVLDLANVVDGTLAEAVDGGRRQILNLATGGVHAVLPSSDDALGWAEDVLGGVGVVVRVSATAVDAVTGLSGSGPAYVFLVAEAMVEAGVLAGLSREVAQALAFQTLLGSSRLLVDGSTVRPACGRRSRLRVGLRRPGCTNSSATACGRRFWMRCKRPSRVHESSVNDLPRRITVRNVCTRR
jgi:Pyrroline-5-carboxylate reductase dimerisation